LAQVQEALRAPVLLISHDREEIESRWDHMLALEGEPPVTRWRSWARAERGEIAVVRFEPEASFP